ncbi:MAG: polysaccharide biosynthesis C-terminal domain-containing protein [Firmicutes bacterium]|nr:polysaccharide biosynthesis C-terminal domain-containing protein [Bacillota bacterium]
MKLIKNYIYNLFFQFLNVVLAIVTAPYIARVIGSKGIGIQSFTDSILQYFIIAGTLAIPLCYGSRTIAYNASDPEAAGKTFFEIFSLKIITITISSLIFLAFVYYTQKEYFFIFLIQAIGLITAAIDISWFFTGMENFRLTITANVLTRVIGVIGIFTWVKNEADVWKYIFILVAVQLLGQIFLWFHLPKYVSFKNIKMPEIKKHLMPVLSLFLPQVIIQVYMVMDRTLLGSLADVSQLGFYDVSIKLIRMSLTVITSMGVVMLPRIAGIFASGDMDTVRDYISRSFNVGSYLAFPLAFGIAAGAGSFVPWFYGAKFTPSILLLAVISPMIIILAWSNVTAVQYLLPLKREREFTVAVSIGAVSSLILNLLLIPVLKALGAAITIVTAESIVTFILFIFVRKEIPLIPLFRNMWKYLASAIIMASAIYGIGLLLGPKPYTTILQALSGMAVYAGSQALLKSEANAFLFEKAINLVKSVAGKS